MKTQKSINLLLSLPFLIALEILLASSVAAQAGPLAPRLPAASGAAAIHLNPGPQYGVNLGNARVAGLPAGPVQLSSPLISNPANDAWLRNNAWAAYKSGLYHIPTATNPNRLAQHQNLVDQDRFVERPNSAHRYNFQFSDNEIRSVQAALRRLGIYSGQVDGILGPDTRRAIEQYQVQYNRPVTGQPDRWLNASLGIF